MKKETTMFPKQKLSIKDKTDDWGKECVDYIIGNGEHGTKSFGDKTEFEEMQSNYDLYNSIFNEKDLKYVTDPFNQNDGFPASPQNFNIIKPKIDLLIGEETKRPDNYKISRTSQGAVSDMQESLKKMLMDYIMSSIVSGMSESEANEFISKMESGEIMPPEKISSFMSRDYKDVAELSAHHSLNYLKERLNTKHEFNKGFSDLLKAAKEVFYVGIRNGEPSLERVNPLYFSHDTSPDLEFIEDGDWACRKMIVSYSEAYDMLYDKMSESDLDELMDMAGQGKSNGKYGKQKDSAVDYMHIDMHITSKSTPDNFDANIVNVWHATWKSYKKVGFLTYEDESGQIQETVVSEDYMVVGTEIALEWKWVIEVWEGYRIGSDLYIGIQPIEYQHISKENPNSQKLPYFGVIYNNGKSLVSIMRPLQYMYIILWYRLELALARDKGKVLNMDITQIPKDMNIDPAKWMHYLSSVGVNFINPYDEGWNIPGREGGRPSQFNQITAMDLTMSNVIGEYVNLMSKIEDMVSEISGVTRQRQGSISSSELVGNVERSVQQSAYITESLFWTHSQCKKNVLRGLLNTAKEAWRDSGKTKLHYIMDDSSRAFMELSDEFFYEDLDVFPIDSTKEMQNVEMIKSLYQPAMQNGATLLDIAEIVTMDNITEMKEALKRIEEKRVKMQEEANEAENQRQMQLVQMQNEAKQLEIEARNAELEMQKYKIDSDNNTKIYVAELGAYRGLRDIDANNNGVPDPMEIADMAIRTTQVNADIADKQMQSNIKIQSEANKASLENKKVSASVEAEKMKMSIEKSKIDLERYKIEQQKIIQKAKDDAAYKREQLKSKTAKANKVSGEK